MRSPFLEGGCLDGRARFGGTALASLTLAAMSAVSGASITHSPETHDVRTVRLEAFFHAYHCPGPLHIQDYLRAADAYDIDYRLLPALSIRESTCGRFAQKNNRWGWDSSRTGFSSVAMGIEFIARQLAFGRNYRGKTLQQKLYTYNPKPRYAEEVQKLMREIAVDAD